MSGIELLEGVASVPRAEWDALLRPDDSPFLEWDWLASLEEAGTLGPRSGWLPRPLVARDRGRLVAACPVYVKGNSEGEFVFDHAWADAAFRAGIRYYPKLLVGVPFTPVGGSRMLVAPGASADTWRRRLAGALRELCHSSRLSGVHVNFCPAEELPPLEAEGFSRRLGLQYHWHNAGYGSFDDFLSRFRSKRRNQIRRERRAVREAGVEVEVLDGNAIPDELFPRMFALYRSTIEGNPWGRQYLNPRFYDLVRDRFRHRLCFVVARMGGEVIAGTFNVRKGDALYGRYWGALRDLPYLHFELCYYRAVEHCIEHGLARFEPGAGGDFKQLRGFDAQPTWSAHLLADPRLAEAVRDWLRHERERMEHGIAWLRDESALKREG